MYDLRPIHPQEVDPSSNRSKIIGAAVVIVGLAALGAYSFASENSPKPVPQKIALTQVRTTPEYAEVMPPPVTPTPSAEKPAAPHRAKADTQQSADDEAATHAKQPNSPPTPLQTPPENAAPQQGIQPSGPPEPNSQGEAPDAGQPQ